MARRVSLPSADDLFRATEEEKAAKARGAAARGPVHAVPDQPEPEAPRKPSGRVRHDEKMTVYVTSQELLDLEHARLSLRAEHGLAVDRGRLVREALAPRARRPRAERRRERAGPPADRGMTITATSRRRPRPRRRVRRLRAAPRQLRGSLRPAAQPDLEAQARHHRGRALQGHRRVHRARQGRRSRRWDLEQTSSFLLVAATLLDLKAARLLPQGDVEDEEDLALLEARDLLFARLLQYRAFKQVAGVLADAAGGGVPAAPALGRAGGAVRDPAARGADRHRPRPVRGAGRQGARAQAGARGRPAATSTPPG